MKIYNSALFFAECMICKKFQVQRKDFAINVNLSFWIR